MNFQRSYNELISLRTFEERLNYLMLKGLVGDRTFGGYRYLNQGFYASSEWKSARNDIIVRDLGRDLACEGHDLLDGLVVHHINPISVEDLLSGDTRALLDPRNLVLTSERTHKIIHYGYESQLPNPFVERRPNDTCPWKM